MMFNLTKEPFDDPKVREAFAYAFDRATFCEQIRSGDCSPAYSMIPEGVPGAIDTEMFAFDPDAAQEALAASSYGGPEDLPEITMSYVSDNPAEQPRVEWIAGQYRDILGVTITLEPLESTAWIATLEDPEVLAHMTLLGWGQDYPDPQNWLSILWTCDGINSASGYCSEEFDMLTAQGDTEIDQDTRLGYYEQAGELLVNDLPVIFLTNSLNTFLVSPAVSGYEITTADWAWPGERSSAMTIDLDE
jgi:oligopeptide transport system substrate-binding protein